MKTKALYPDFRVLILSALSPKLRDRLAKTGHGDEIDLYRRALDGVVSDANIRGLDLLEGLPTQTSENLIIFTGLGLTSNQVLSRVPELPNFFRELREREKPAFFVGVGYVLKWIWLGGQCERFSQARTGLQFMGGTTHSNMSGLTTGFPSTFHGYEYLWERPCLAPKDTGFISLAHSQDYPFEAGKVGKDICMLFHPAITPKVAPAVGVAEKKSVSELPDGEYARQFFRNALMQCAKKGQR